MKIWTRNRIFKYNVRSCPTYIPTYVRYHLQILLDLPMDKDLYGGFPISNFNFVLQSKEGFLVTYLYLTKTFFCSISKYFIGTYVYAEWHKIALVVYCAKVSGPSEARGAEGPDFGRYVDPFSIRG